MTRSEFVRLMVLREIADSFENIDQIILPEISDYGAQLGMAIERSEVVAALTGLVHDGLAKAYFSPRITSAESEALDCMPAVDVPETDPDFGTYFKITKAGVEAYLSHASHLPVDDEGNLLPGWQLAES